MVLEYSLRLSRRAVTRPGSGLIWLSALSNSACTNLTSASIWAAGGRGMPFGGILAERIFCMIRSQPSRFSVNDAGVENTPRFRPPEDNRSLWQAEQVFEKMG